MLLKVNYFNVMIEDSFLINLVKLLVIVIFGTLIYGFLIYILKLSKLLNFKLGEENKK